MDEERVFKFNPENQNRIFTALLYDDEFLNSYKGIIKPKHFSSQVLQDMTKILFGFFEKYSRNPKEAEFLEELDIFLTSAKMRHKIFPCAEYTDTVEDILKMGREGNLDYAKDKAKSFVQHQAMVQALLESAKRLEKGDFNGIVRLINDASSVGSEDGGLRILSSYKAKDVEWLWQNHIPFGEITLLVGDPGVGKSYFSIFLSAKISKGGSFPDDASGKAIESGKVLVLSTDDDPDYAILPRANAAGADADKIVVLEGSRDEKGRIKILNLTTDIIRLENILKKDKGYNLVIIDPLSDYIGHVDTHKYSDVRWALAPLLALARKYKVAVVGIMHCNKNTSLQVLYRIMGSMGFASVARSIWLIAKDRDDESGKRRYFSPLKNNLAPEQKTLAFNLENKGKVAKVVFESNPVIDDFDVEEILVPQERASETKRAKRFILETLKDGAVTTKEIKSIAREVGISWGTLRRAYDKMSGVKAVKERGAGGKWYWELDEFTRRQALVEAEAETKDVGKGTGENKEGK